MKVAIGICEKINGICTTMGCFRAFNNKEKHFEPYINKDIELSAFFTCQLCSSSSKEWLHKLGNRLVKEQVSALHLSVCIVECKVNKKQEIIDIFETRGIKVIEGTH